MKKTEVRKRRENGKLVKSYDQKIQLFSKIITILLFVAETREVLYQFFKDI